VVLELAWGKSRVEWGRWYEDFSIEEVISSPGKTMTEGEIVGHAMTYDPQPFHIDATAAAASEYGGLIASGWQVAAVAFRLFMATHPFADGASLGSPGCDALRWVHPVRPGDTIRVEANVTAKRLSASKPDRGLVNLDWKVLNQNHDIVMTMSSIQLVRCGGAGQVHATR
jgi:acyl dehydratase